MHANALDCSSFPPTANRSARDDFSLALGKVTLLYSLMEDKEWGDYIFATMLKYLLSLPALVDVLNSITCASPEKDLFQIDIEHLDMAMAVLTILGEAYSTFHFGSNALYRKTSGSSTEINEGVILRVQFHGSGRLKGDGEQEGPDELVTILPNDRSELVQVPRCDVMPLSAPPPAALIKRLLKAAPQVLPVLQATFDTVKVTSGTSRINQIDRAWAMACLNDIYVRLMKALLGLYQNDDFIASYLPLVKEVSSYALASAPCIPVEPAKKEKVFESKHPYDNNTKQTFEVSFRGAVKLTIEFDPQSRTETGCDYLVLYKDRSKRERWGLDKYSGREQWPGCGGRPPLEIPANSFVVYWYTDGSNNDWGWRFTVTATMAQIDASTAPVSQLEQRIHHVAEVLYELPKAQPQDFDQVTRLVLDNDSDSFNPSFFISSKNYEAGPTASSERSFEQCLSYQSWPQQFRVLRDDAILTAEPNPDMEAVGKLIQGTIVDVIEQRNLWLAVRYTPTCILRAPSVPQSVAEILTNLKDTEPQAHFTWDCKAVNSGDFMYDTISAADGIVPPMCRVTKLGSPDVSILIGTEEMVDGCWFWEVLVEKLGDEMWVGITHDPKLVLLYHEEITSIRLNPRAWSYNDGSRGRGFECAGKRLENLPEQYRGGDTLGFFLDLPAHTLAIYRNGSLQGVCSSLPHNTGFYAFAALDFELDAVVLRRVIRIQPEERRIPYDRLWTLQHHKHLLYVEPWSQTAGEVSDTNFWAGMDGSSEADDEPEEIMQDEGMDSERFPGHRDDVRLEIREQSCNAQVEEQIEDDVTVEGPKTRLQEVVDYSVRHDLQGQTGQLWSFAIKSYQASTVRLASQVLLMVVSRWPEYLPFSIDMFGSFEKFWKLLFLTFSIENDGNFIAPRVSCKGLLDKLFLSVSRNGDAGCSFMQQLLNKAILEMKNAVNTLPKGMMVSKTFETPHPYVDNMDTEWVIHFPGAKRIKIVFDRRSKTETNCDWIIFYKAAARSVKYGDRFHGRNGSENFPGYGKRKPLLIDADRCVAHFHSDGSTVDWGVKFTAYGVLSDNEDKMCEGATTVKQAEDADTVLDMSCWLLEYFAREQAEEVIQIIYSRSTLEVLRHCILLLPRKRRVRLLHLITYMAQEYTHIRHHKDLNYLARSLWWITVEQYELERGSRSKSIYLQALVQCIVSIRTALTKLRDSHAIVNQVPAMVWQPTPSISIECEGMIATHKGKPGEVLLVTSAAAMTTGLTYSWDVVLIQCRYPSSVAIGFVESSAKGGSCSLGVEANCSRPGVWISQTSVSVNLNLGGATNFILHRHLEGILPGKYQKLLDIDDIITFIFSPKMGILEIEKNGITLGKLLGPPLSQSFIELPVGWADCSYLASATLSHPGDEIMIRPRTSQSMISPVLDMLSISSTGSESSGQDENWFTNVCMAVEMLSEFACHQTPCSLLLSEFRPQLKASETITIQSTHPFDNTASCSTIMIPDSKALEVRLDEVTQMHDQDEISIHGVGDKDGVLLLGPGEQSSDKCENQGLVEVGDVVVRSQTWRFGDEDGGPGCRGVVTRLDFWESVPQKGVWVRWRHGCESMYQIADLQVLPRPTRKMHPLFVRVQGDTVHVNVRPRVSDQRNEFDFKGSLSFSEAARSSVTIEPQAELDLDYDFTIEMWLRLNAAAAKNGKTKVAISQVFSSEFNTMSQLRLSDLGWRVMSRVILEPNNTRPSALVTPEEIRTRLTMPLRRRVNEDDEEDDVVDDDVEELRSVGSREPLQVLNAGVENSGNVVRSLLSGEPGASIWSTNDLFAAAMEVDVTEEDDEIGVDYDDEHEDGDIAAGEGLEEKEEEDENQPLLGGFLRLQPSMMMDQAIDSELVHQLLLMGFEEGQVRSSLIAARNDLMQAIEYCMTGIPNERLLTSRLAEYIRNQYSARQRFSSLEDREFDPLSSCRTVTEANVKVGLSVVRGRHWHYDNQDGGEAGIVIGWYKGDRSRALSSALGGPVDNPISPGWARVRWENGVVNSYEIGAFDLFSLNLASSGPGKVQRLQAQATMADGVRLMWRKPTDEGTPALTCYHVLRDGMQIGTTDSSTTLNYVDRDVEPGKTYLYSVRGVNAAGNGVPSDIAQVYVPRLQDRLTMFKLAVTETGGLKLMYGTPPDTITLDGGFIDDERWTHVAIVSDGDHMRLIVDGAKKDTKKFSGTRPVSRGRPIYLGALGTSQDHWDGQIFDVRFWNAGRTGSQLRKFSSALPSKHHALTSGSGQLKVFNRGKQRFPSVRINSPLQSHGKAYYEATIRSSGCIQIGWALPEFSPTTFFMGVGDDDRSWACDGLRQMKWHGISPPVQASPSQYSHGLPYGNDWAWSPGDTIGCMLDMDSGSMRFSYNGRDLGEAFRRCKALAGRYRVIKAEGVDGYPSVREEAESCVHVPEGAVLRALQAEINPDGVLWLKVKGGWIPHRSMTAPEQFFVQRLEGNAPLKYDVGPERCLYLQRFSLEEASLQSRQRRSMQVTNRGLQCRAEDSLASVNGLVELLVQMLEIDPALDVVTVGLDIWCARSELSGLPEEACAGLVLDDCEILVYPYQDPPTFTIQSLSLQQEFSLETPFTEDVLVRLVVTVRRAGPGVVRVLCPKSGRVEVQAGFFLPAFFHGDWLGTIGVKVSPRLRESRVNEDPLAFQALAVFAGELSDMPSNQRFEELRVEYRTMLQQNTLEPIAPPLGLPASRLDLVWTDPCGKFKVLAPDVPPSHVFFGHIVCGPSVNCNPEALISVEDASFAAPVGYERLGMIPGGPTMWLPKPPSDQFLAAGVFFTTDSHPPNTKSLRCVRRNVTVSAVFVGLDVVGIDQADLDGFSLMPDTHAVIPNVMAPFTFLQRAKEEKSVMSRQSWEGIMPAMSCSEEEGVDFNIGWEPFKHRLPTGYKPLINMAQPEATFALQVFNGEKAVWESINNAHELTERTKDEDRLMARFELNDGEGVLATNAVFCPQGDNKILSFPPAKLNGCTWSLIHSPIGESNEVWGFKMSVAPCFPVGVQYSGRLKEKFIQYISSQSIDPKSDIVDIHLVRYVNFQSRKRNINKTALLNSDWASLAPTDKELVAWPVLAQAVMGSPDRFDLSSLHQPTQDGANSPHDSLQSSINDQGWGEEKLAASSTTNREEWVIAGPEMLLRPDATPMVDIYENTDMDSIRLLTVTVGQHLRRRGVAVQAATGEWWSPVETVGISGFIRHGNDSDQLKGRNVRGTVLCVIGAALTKVNRSRTVVHSGHVYSVKSHPERSNEWLALGDKESPEFKGDSLSFPTAPSNILLSIADFPPSHSGGGDGVGLLDSRISSGRKAAIIQGRWRVGVPLDVLAVVTRTTGYIRSKDVGMADGIACCFRVVDGSMQILLPPFNPGKENYAGSDLSNSTAYLGGQFEEGDEVAFEVMDDGYQVKFRVSEVGGQHRAAQIQINCGADSGRGKIAFMRLSDDYSDESRGWLRVVSDDRGATLRDGVSIDEANQLGRLPRGAVVRFFERGE